MRWLLSTVLLFLAVTAWGGPLRIELDSLDATPGTPEGVWRLPSGTIFEIKARSGQPGVYDLVLLHSSDLSVPAGASFGHMTVGADSHTYDCLPTQRHAMPPERGAGATSPYLSTLLSPGLP